MLKSEKEIYKEVIDEVGKAYDKLDNTIGQLCDIYYDKGTELCDGCPCYSKGSWWTCIAQSALDDLSSIEFNTNRMLCEDEDE